MGREHATLFCINKFFNFIEIVHPTGYFLLELALINARGNTPFLGFIVTMTLLFSASDVSQLDDLDELEVYLNTESNPQSGSEITSYSFEAIMFHCNVMIHLCIQNKIMS